MTDDGKFGALRTLLSASPRWALSLSGGVDSVFLLHAMAETVGPQNVLALTARGRNFPQRESREAAAAAAGLGVRQVALEFEPMAIPEFTANGPERCYYCKLALFRMLIAAANASGFTLVADGTNADDTGDYRPGMRATAELGVASPLLEAGIGKAEIRAGLRARGVELWNKPSFACLASRFPYGTAIDADALARVESAENFFLDTLGFANIRVRHHGDIARLEVEPDDRARLLEGETAAETYAALRGMGYRYVTVDLLGYRTGSLNEGLQKELQKS